MNASCHLRVNSFSRLSEEGVSDKAYQHAIDVWETFQCEDMGDYHDVYLKTDVYLLADVFENVMSLTRQALTTDGTFMYKLFYKPDSMIAREEDTEQILCKENRSSAATSVRMLKV